MELEYGLSPATLAHKLRRFERLHRFAQWLRHDLWGGLVEALIELGRFTFRGSARFGPPTGTFSIYQALRNGFPKVNGRLLLEDQGHPAVTEDSLFVLGHYCQHLEQPWPIFWSEHAPARLATESLVLLDNKRVCIESVYGFPRLRGDPAYRFFHLPPSLRLKGSWTSVVSRWVPTSGHPNYTHWLLDALPRLAMLPELPRDTQILVPSSLFPSERESLALLGLLDRCRFTSEIHLEVERYFFSSPTAMLQCYNPFGINFLRSAFLPKRDPHYSGPKKFFVARTGSVRNLKNMDELHDFFTRIGWALVQPAELTFAQQIKLFSEADAICGTVGSGLTNAVFCRVGCQILLLAQDFMLDGWLDCISQVVEADYHCLICPSGYRHDIQPDLQRVKDLLRRLGHAV
jgi:hypothetical protein